MRTPWVPAGDHYAYLFAFTVEGEEDKLHLLITSPRPLSLAAQQERVNEMRGVYEQDYAVRIIGVEQVYARRLLRG